ncbi:MAG TPA: RimK family protein [Gammaproteobacteria bacterium]|jgi:glutathione synthase/RimK-type ligase-like ATP-grasp enzyme
MAVYVVVDNPKGWPLDLAGAEVIAARRYLSDRQFFDSKKARVFNLCRSYGYQTVGYYVSLLAAARGHKPLPSVSTLQDLRQTALARIVAEDVNQKLQKLLAPLESNRFELSIYFGRNTAKRYDQLSQMLFNLFPAPLLRAEFVRNEQWRLQNLRVIAADDIPATHRDFVIEQAQRFFARPRIIGRKQARYKLAILVDPHAVDAPSDDRAIRRFVRAAAKAGVAASVIGKQDYGRVAEFDGLFLRETTAVNHHTYRFATRAAAEGLVVIDDPESIIKCTNKVYQAELFARNEIGCPETLVVHRDNAADVGLRLGFPCVLKRPDSSFSVGVVKVENADSLNTELNRLFKQSDLVVAQRFLPSQFDWRIGVLGGRALFACRYFMARGHWQIQKAHGESRRSYGKVEAIAIENAPKEAVALAVRTANLIGQGFYGVDLKELDGRFYVMEINDNPNVEAGYEDTVLKDALYSSIIGYFLDRFERRIPAPSDS